MSIFIRGWYLVVPVLLATILVVIAFNTLSQNSNKKRIIGYFPSWASYREGRSLSSTATAKLTHLVYAYCKLDDDGRILADDSFSALQQNQTASDGTLLTGNFNAFRDLKSHNPNLKIMLSIGGWNLSTNFSDVAADIVKREHFVTSAIEHLDKYGFDGYEIDWRYPVLGGPADNNYRKDDLTNYLKLVAELRTACETRGGGCELSMTVPSVPFVRAGWDFKAFSKQVNFFTVLTSDFAGSWSERTSHKSPLYRSKNHPQISIASIIKELKTVGIPEDKLVMYVSADGTAWKGVTGGTGLYETHKGMAYGNWDNRFTGATGKVAYRDIVKRLASGDYQQNWDVEILAHTLYREDKQEFISYESPRSLQEKLFFADQEGLSGIALWELTSDVESGSGLLDVIYSHYNSVGAYWLKLERWLHSYWIVLLSVILGAAFGGLLLLYVQRRRAANEWLENRNFIQSIGQLSQNMNQVAYLAMTPPPTLVPKLTSLEPGTLDHLANQSAAVIHQLMPLAEATQPSLSVDSQSQALLNLERFTDALSGTYSIDAMLDVMFNFLTDDDRVSAVQLTSDSDLIREDGELLSSENAPQDSDFEAFSLDSSRNLALLSHSTLGSYKLRLQFSESLSDEEEVYFRGLCNQVLFACQQIKNLVKQPQLLSDICAIAQRRDKLLFVKGEKGYSGVHATDLKAPLYLYLRLRALLQYFPELLVQVHRSYLVNPEAVTGVVRKKSTYHLCVGNELVPISRSYLNHLKTVYPHWFEVSTEAA